MTYSMVFSVYVGRGTMSRPQGPGSFMVEVPDTLDP